MRHLVLLLMLLRLPAFAQETQNMLDVVYLEGGSVLKGHILEWTSDTLTFRLLAGTEMRLPTRSVIRAEQRPDSHHARILHDLKKGPYGTAALGLLVNSNRATLMLDASGGYRFDPRLALGIGAGINQYSFYEEVFYPLFLEWRAHWSENTMVPYSTVRFGFSRVAWNGDNGFFGAAETRDYTNPLLFQLALGWRLWQKGKVHLATELGYLHQRADYNYTIFFDNDTQEGEISRTFRHLSFRVLVGF